MSQPIFEADDDGRALHVSWLKGDTFPPDDSGVADLAVKRDGVVHHVGQVLWERSGEWVHLHWVLNERGEAMRDGQ